MSGREKYADSLMDALGKIDDKYINEAQIYTPKRKMPVYLKAAIGVAASFLLVFTAVIPIFLSIIGGKGNSVTNSSPGRVTLQARMYSALINSGTEAYETLPDIDGAALVWQTEADKEYHVIKINSYDTAKIMSASGEPVRTPEDNGVKIWVVTGEGLYMSPELKKSNGNTDVKVFDYSQELLITDKTAQTILNILKENEK